MKTILINPELREVVNIVKNVKRFKQNENVFLRNIGYILNDTFNKLTNRGEELRKGGGIK